jgi:hypothetical protein
VELANATYTGTEEGPVTLVKGRWEGESYVEGGSSRPAVGLVEDFYLFGDLDGGRRMLSRTTRHQNLVPGG